MNCFENYIGLQTCKLLSTSKSGYYINNFAEVSLKNLDALADAEQKHYLNVWNDVQKVSLLTFENLIKSELSKQVILNENLYSYLFGQFDNFEDLTQTNNFVGVRIKGIKEKYLSIFFNEINFYSKEDKTDCKFYIYDLNGGRKLLEVTQDLIIGFNTISLNYRYTENYYNEIDIFVCYDSNTIESVKTNEFNQCFESRDLYSLNVSGAKINNTQLLIKQHTSDADNCGGIQLDFTLDCSFDNLICINKSKFTEAWANVLISNLLLKRKFSERLNMFTVEFSNEELDDMIEKYLNNAKSIVSNVCENINIPCSTCFEKNKQNQPKWIRP